MARRYVVFIGLVILVSAGYFVWPQVLSWFLPPSLGRPQSDVPLVTDIGWCASQEGLTLSELSAEAVDPRLALFNTRFLIRYHLKGSVKYQNGWRPRIKEAQITGRVVSRSDNWSMTVADVLIVPVVDLRQDRTYSGDEISFDLKLEQIMQTMGWGQNRYEIKCGDKTARVTVEQLK